MTTDTTNGAKEQARAQLDTLIAMIERLNHAQTCDDFEADECFTMGTIVAHLGIDWPNTREEFEEVQKQYHDEDAARQAIDEDPLEVSVRSNWHTPHELNPEDHEYNILLCTGGPAVRITGTLSQHSEPDSAVIEYQDWSTPWTSLRIVQHEENTMLEYANCFYFGD